MKAGFFLRIFFGYREWHGFPKGPPKRGRTCIRHRFIRRCTRRLLAVSPSHTRVADCVRASTSLRASVAFDLSRAHRRAEKELNWDNQISAFAVILLSGATLCGEEGERNTLTWVLAVLTPPVRELGSVNMSTSTSPVPRALLHTRTHTFPNTMRLIALDTRHRCQIRIILKSVQRRDASFAAPCRLLLGGEARGP